MKFHAKIFALFLFITTAATGQNSDTADTDTNTCIPISGALPAEIKPQSKPYLATGDIFVTPGSTVKIGAGVTILFNAFVVLHVQGVLLAEGTRENPVVFTSINDSAANPRSTVPPAPFDWNGIDVYDNAMGTIFTWCQIRYSVYGIRSQTIQFRIMNCAFLFNGKSAVSINGVTQNVSAEPYSFRAITESKPPAESLSLKAPAKSAKPKPQVQVAQKTGNKRSTRIATRIAYFTIGCAGLGVGAWGTVRFIDSYNHFKDMNVNSEENKKKYTLADYKEARIQRNTDAAIMAGGYALGLIGVIVFTWSCTF